MEHPKLLVQDVSKTYRNGRQRIETLVDIDLTVNRGEFVTAIGPSGCGKRTLFNIVAGVDQPSEGIGAIDDDAQGTGAWEAAYRPQQPLLLPWRTVVENVMLELDVPRFARKNAEFQAQEL